MEIPTRKVVVAGILGSLTYVLSITPLGFIPVPTPAGSATTLHIPAILAGLVEGPVTGLLVGLIFGTMSFLRSGMPMFKDPLIAFVPRLLIGVATYYTYRVLKNQSNRWPAALLGGALAGHTFYAFGLWLRQRYSELPSASVWLGNQMILLAGGFLVGVLAAYLLWRFLSGDMSALSLAAAAGAATNTVGVLGLTVMRGYFGPWPESGFVALSVALLHGIPEIIVAGAITAPVARRLKQSLWSRRNSHDADAS